MSYCTHVASCCARVLLVPCFTRVVSCCAALFSGLHSVTGYLGLALVFVWGDAPQERFNGYFASLKSFGNA